MLYSALLLLVLSASASAFSLPFKVHTAVTNITQGGQTLEQTSEYFVANLTLGTPGQLFTVVIDTRSSDLVIPDKSCPTTGLQSTCFGKRLFDANVSSTYKIKSSSNGSYQVNNNLGTFSGFVGVDLAVIGDRKTDLITVPNVKFLQSSSIGIGVQGLKADGVLGLAFTSKSQINGKSPFVQGVEQGDIVNGIMSIWLEHYGQTDDLGTHGVIYYGGLDPIHCVANPKWFPLSAAGFYQATVTNFRSNSSLGSDSVNKPSQAIIDSTNAYISGPTQYLNAILDSIGINYNTVKSWPPVVDCNTKVTLTFTFIGGVQATVTQRDIVTKSNGQCILNIVPNTDRIELGIPFLRGRCTYFDVTAQRIGFTPAKLQE